jgi:hypothetical protein
MVETVKLWDRDETEFGEDGTEGGAIKSQLTLLMEGSTTETSTSRPIAELLQLNWNLN